MKLSLKKVVNGPFDQNAYILYNSKKFCVLIDPGLDYNIIISELNYLKKKPSTVLLTHAHIDHIGIVDKLQKKYNLKVFMHQNDQEIAKNLPKYCQMFGLEVLNAPKITNLISDENSIEIDNYIFKIINTPGHTPGGLSYMIGNNIFVGDTLFNNSVGRTDLPGGSFSVLINSIKNKLFLLDDIVKVYCGHGPDTTIGYEKKNNIFLK